MLLTFMPLLLNTCQGQHNIALASNLHASRQALAAAAAAAAFCCYCCCSLKLHLKLSSHCRCSRLLLLPKLPWLLLLLLLWPHV
jgi:hypothetical protein